MSQSQLTRFTREEFLTRRWNHQPGEQVFVIQPTQGGKTRWLYQLANATPHVKPPVCLVMKPRDPTPAEMTRKYGWKEIDTWPPSRAPWSSRPPGYTLWPKHSLSLDPASIAKTNAHLKRQFEACLMDAYKNGDQITICDEIYGLLAELRMHETILALTTRGSGMKAPIWYATQKPSGTQTGGGLPGQLFNSPVHLFLGYDPDLRNRKTFSLIGGVNTDLVMDEVSKLQVHPIQTPHGIKPVSDLLYINKNGPRGGYLCIIEPW